MNRKAATAAIPDVIAERVFQRADGQEVRAILGRPHRTKQEWACEFQVLGVGHAKVYRVPGEDSLQALQTAEGMMVIQLDAYQREHGLTFLGDSHLGLFRYDFEKLQREIGAMSDHSA